MSGPAMAGRSFKKTWYMQSAAAETGRYRLQGIEINLENGTIVERWQHWSPARQGSVPAMKLKTVKTMKKAMKAKAMKTVVPKMTLKRNAEAVKSEMAASSAAKKSQKGATAKTRKSEKGTVKKKAA